MNPTPQAIPLVLRLGTRGSLLARTQSQWVADLIRQYHPGTTVQLVTIVTSGDMQTERPLTDSGGKGLFVKEIEEALLSGAIDLAVHSAKDLPVELPAELTIAATPPRELPHDVWIGHAGLKLADLPPGAVVGTTSLRRRSQLLARRPDVQTTTFRGNIDTRLRKVAEGQVAGTFLAAAGLRRTSLLPAHAELLPLDPFIPASGQGVLAVQTRAADAALIAALGPLHDPLTEAALAFERSIVHALAGDCLSPIGVNAWPRQNGPDPASSQTVAPATGWIARAWVSSPDGRQVARATLLTEDPTRAGLFGLQDLLLTTIRRRGGATILSESRRA